MTIAGALEAFRNRGVDAPNEALLGSAEWSPLLALCDGWYRVPLGPAAGMPISAIDAAVACTGLPLPATVREWFRLAGAHPLLSDDTSPDYPVPLIRADRDPRMLVLYEECQDCWRCGVLAEHRSTPDPPVYFESFAFDLVRDAGFDPGSLVDGRFVRVSESIPRFMHAMTVRQLALRSEASSAMRPEVSGAVFRAFDTAPLRARNGVRLLLDFPAGYSPEFDGADVIAIAEWGFAARTTVALETALNDLSDAGQRPDDIWHTGGPA